MEIFLVPKHVVQMQYLMGKHELKVYNKTKNFIKKLMKMQNMKQGYLYTSMYGTLDELVSEPRLDLAHGMRRCIW